MYTLQSAHTHYLHTRSRVRGKKHIGIGSLQLSRDKCPLGVPTGNNNHKMFMYNTIKE